MTISYTYSWIHTPNTPIPGATGTSYNVQNSDLNTTISCIVTATNGVDTITVNASNPQLITAGGGGGVPVNTVAPVISGETTVGSALSCTTGTWTNSPTSYSYAWTRNGVATGATGPNYTSVTADITTQVACEVTATNLSGSTTAQSNTLAIAAAGGGVPTNTVLPVISGLGVTGEPLTCTTGTWTNSPTAYVYYWLKDGSIPVGTDSNTFIPTALGMYGCEVTATNAAGGGGTLSVTSNGINVIDAVAVARFNYIASGHYANLYARYPIDSDAYLPAGSEVQWLVDNTPILGGNPMTTGTLSQGSSPYHFKFSVTRNGVTTMSNIVTVNVTETDYNTGPDGGLGPNS